MYKKYRLFEAEFLEICLTKFSHPGAPTLHLKNIYIILKEKHPLGNRVKIRKKSGLFNMDLLIHLTPLVMSVEVFLIINRYITIKFIYIKYRM